MMRAAGRLEHERVPVLDELSMEQSLVLEQPVELRTRRQRSAAVGALVPGQVRASPARDRCGKWDRTAPGTPPS